MIRGAASGVVPIPVFPVFRCGRGKAGQSERRRKHVLAEAGVWILRVERIDEQRRARPDRSGGHCWVQEWRLGHVRRAPSATRRLYKGLIGHAHGLTLMHKVLFINVILQATLIRQARSAGPLTPE